MRTLECGAADIHTGDGWALESERWTDLYGDRRLELMTNTGGGMVSFEKLHDSNSRAIFM